MWKENLAISLDSDEQDVEQNDYWLKKWPCQCENSDNKLNILTVNRYIVMRQEKKKTEKSTVNHVHDRAIMSNLFWETSCMRHGSSSGRLHY